MYFSSLLRVLPLLTGIIALTLYILFVPNTASAGTLEYQGVQVVTESSSSGRTSVFHTLLNENGLYLNGFFQLTTDFDPGDGTDNFTSAGGFDCYFTRHDANGVYEWTKIISSTGNCTPGNMVSDAEGNIYLFATFAGTVDFDPGVGTSYATSSAPRPNPFLAKYDADFELQWVKTWGDTDFNQPVEMLLHNNDLYLAGWFAGTQNFSADGTDIHTSNGAQDSFLAKWSTDGTYQWTRTWGGTGGDFAFVVEQHDGLLYTGGQFSGTVDFDPGVATTTYTSNGSTDAYVSAFTTDGTYQWTRTWGGTGGDSVSEIVVSDETLFVAGGFSNTVDFDPSSGTEEHTSSGSTDVYLLAFDHAGIHQWARAFGGNGFDGTTSLSLTEDGLFLSGNISGSIDFDGDGTIDQTVAGGSDAFFTLFTTDGDHVFSQLVGGTGNEYGYMPAFVGDTAGTFFFPGRYTTGTVDFDPTSATDEKTAIGVESSFLTTFTYTNTPPTTITLSTTDIDENTPSGTTIATLGTSDTDESDTHTYTLVSGSGSEDNSLFTISGSDLNLAFTPDYEDPQSADGDNVYSIRIQVTDGEETYTTTFEIEVYDIKDTNRSSGSSTTYVCTDPQASNYDIGGKHKQSLCAYDTDTTPSTPTTDSSVTDLILEHKSIFQTAHDLGITLPSFILNLLGLTPTTLPVRDLELGDEGQDVYNLQVFLNTHGYVLTTDGPGAPGSETTRFGALTQAALARFQQEHQISPAVGYYGPVTRDYINANY